jgi:hypothetical protein
MLLVHVCTSEHVLECSRERTYFFLIKAHSSIETPEASFNREEFLLFHRLHLRGSTYTNSRSYNNTTMTVTADVADAIDYAHSSGIVHNAVMADLPAYVKPKPQLKAMLESFRRDGKQLFLASNSNFEFVSSGMRFLVGEGWQKLFDIVIVSGA